jgi:hypothetical protein
MDTILKREKFVPREEIVLSNSDLLGQARTILGYAPSVLEKQREITARAQGESLVAAAFETLGIEPLEKESVKQYMREQIKKLESQGSNKFVQYMHKKDGEDIVFTAGLVAFLMLLGTVIGSAVNYDATKHVLAHASLIKWLLRVDVIPFGLWFTSFYARHKRAEIHRAEWKTTRIDYYHDPVPDFALERAMQIRKLVSGTVFGIATLTETVTGVETEYSPIPPDPFLVMEYGGLSFFLDVWDEPKFEGRRTK